MQRQRQEQQEQQQRDALFGPNPRRDDARSPASRGSYNDDSERNAAEGEAGGVPSYGGSQSWSGQHEQRQQLTWAQVRDRIDVNERRRGLRSAHESAETGRAALESLQDQKGTLLSLFICCCEVTRKVTFSIFVVQGHENREQSLCPSHTHIHTLYDGASFCKSGICSSLVGAAIRICEEGFSKL